MSMISVAAIGLRAARKARSESRAAHLRRGGASLAAFGRRMVATLPTGAALGCFTAAAWTVALPLGLLVAGASLLVLDWKVNDAD